MFARFVHPGPAQIQTGENEEVREEEKETHGNIVREDKEMSKEKEMPPKKRPRKSESDKMTADSAKKIEDLLKTPKDTCFCANNQFLFEKVHNGPN